jgi:hypothetical protein
MTVTCRSLSGLGLLFATVAGLVPAQSERLGELARQLGQLPEASRRIESERERRADLDEHSEKVLARISGKNAIVDDLIAGRVGLFEAAASFRALNRRRPPLIEFGRDLLACRSDAERYCRQVLAWTRSRASHRPEGTTDSLVTRLEAELEDHLHRYGDVRLPPAE